jgi:outer membrane protein OmpA-like peptidoglycan-associated protein
MKKAIVTLSVILLTAMSAFAGGEKPRYQAAKFSQNWFIDAAGTYSWFAAYGTTYRHLSPLYGKQFGVSGKIGKLVSPSFGVRIGYDLHSSTNRWYGGANPTSHFNLFSQTNDHFQYKSLHVDLMESPIDLIWGYNPDRIYTMWLYGGAALMAADKPSETRFVFHTGLLGGANLSHMELGFLGGVMNNFRLGRAVDFHIDFQATATRWSFDDIAMEPHSIWHRMHVDFTAEAGFMWYLGGRGLDLVPDCEPEVIDCSEQEARIQELLKQLEDCKNGVVTDPSGNTIVINKPCDTVYQTIEAEAITYPFSIFFNKGSYELRDGRDRVNLDAIAKVAKEKGYKVTLRGTCDSATASSAFNKTLAENRCRKIKDELVKLGVKESNIVVDAVGGVKELNPTEYDRRVLISLSK